MRHRTRTECPLTFATHPRRNRKSLRSDDRWRLFGFGASSSHIFARTEFCARRRCRKLTPLFMAKRQVLNKKHGDCDAFEYVCIDRDRGLRYSTSCEPCVVQWIPHTVPHRPINWINTQLSTPGPGKSIHKVLQCSMLSGMGRPTTCRHSLINSSCFPATELSVLQSVSVVDQGMLPSEYPS